MINLSISLAIFDDIKQAMKKKKAESLAKWGKYLIPAIPNFINLSLCN